jgi:four helix bundle protein
MTRVSKVLASLWSGTSLAQAGTVTPAEFKARTRGFALDVIRFVRRLPRTVVSAHIARQLLRSGTSQASNYRAACRARSKADFIAKLGIVEEELDESLFWFDLLVASKEQGSSDDIKRLSAEADELLAMTVQSIRTARGGSR